LLHVATLPQPTSHAHDGPQTMSRHEPPPAQSTLQRPAPQVTPWQLRNPVQLMVHGWSSGQTTPLRHAFCVEHSTLQLQPSGHATFAAQPPLTAQSMVQVFWPAEHDVHTAGQTPASPVGDSASTQNPSTQIRSSAQRTWSLQTKSPL
jgi:hypothetical protein